MEPLLESIDLATSSAIERCSGDTNKSAPDNYEPLVSWVIIGGESGHNARHCSLMWIRSIVNQCKAADIPVYAKQLGTEEAKQTGTHRSDTKGANP
jgi:protein gp37